LPNLPSIPSGVQAKPPRLAYLLSRYPAVSHTFFLKEVLGLRERGLQVFTASINPPDRPKEILPAIEAKEVDTTFYVKAGGAVKLLFQVAGVALLNPSVLLRGLAASCKLSPWDLKARAYSLFYLAEALLVGSWMRRNALDHLHVHFGGPVASVGMLTSQAWRIPWSVTLHGPDEFFDQEAFYLRKKIESVSVVICISDFSRSQAICIAPSTAEERLEVMRLGVDCSTLRPRIEEEEDKRGALKLVCTGRLVPVKGHRILLQAIAPLIASGLDITCTLIGDGAERKSLENLSRQLGIQDRTHFLGALAHHQALDEVAKADVFILASFAEGLPVALMEAMAFGVPCISTTIAAIPELIHSGENGLLVPPSNVETLQAAVRQLAEDPELRTRLGRNARATVEASYNLATNLDKLADMWRHRLYPQESGTARDDRRPNSMPG
jgi:glycosyltransferase involved in cell wall biosynthesis